MATMHPTLFESAELHARGEFGLISFLSMKETEHVGAFYCLSLVLEFGDVSVTEKKKAREEEKARFLLLSPISFS